MTRRRIILLGSWFALLATIAVIGLAGYYTSLSLLVYGQVPMIFLPTLIPFLVLAGRSEASKVAVALVAAPLVFGWASVIYIDTRPYEGGGASMALLLGWAACVLSVLLAFLAPFVAPFFKQAR